MKSDVRRPNLWYKMYLPSDSRDETQRQGKKLDLKLEKGKIGLSNRIVDMYLCRYHTLCCIERKLKEKNEKRTRAVNKHYRRNYLGFLRALRLQCAMYNVRIML